MATGTIPRPMGDDLVRIPISAGTSKTISCPSGASFALAFTQQTRFGLYLFHGPASGVLTYETIKAASGVTIDVTVANKLTVTSSTTGRIGLWVFNGQVTVT